MPIDLGQYPELHLGYAEHETVSSAPLVFSRFLPGAGHLLPDVDPPKYEALRQSFMIRLQATSPDGVPNEIAILPVAFSYGQARNGHAGSAEATVSLSQMTKLVKELGAKDVYDFVEKHPRIKAFFMLRSEQLYVGKLEYQTGVSSRREPSSASSGEWQRMFVGQLDQIRPQHSEDRVQLSFRDLASRLWEVPILFEVWQNVTPAQLAEDIASVCRIHTKIRVLITERFQNPDGTFSDAGRQSEIEVKTISPTLTQPPLGVVDASKPEDRWLRVRGARPIDILSSAASLSDAVFFVIDGTLFFLSQEDLAAATGRVILTYGKNLIDFDVDHNTFQSRETTLIVAVHSPDLTDLRAIPGGSEVDTNGLETLYLEISDINIGPVMHSKPVEMKGDQRYYHAERYGIPVRDAVNETVALFRDIVSKEVVIYTTIQGRLDTTILDRYVVVGTGTILDGRQYEAQMLTHRVEAGKWTAEVVLTNHIQIQNEIEGAAPAEGFGSTGVFGTSEPGS